MRHIFLLTLAVIDVFCLGSRAAVVFVTDAENGSVHRLDLNANTDTRILGPVGGVPPTWSLAIDSSRNLYTVFGNADKIEKYTEFGTYLGTFATVPSGTSIRGLAFDTGGSLYASYGTSIHKFGPTGLDLGVFASTGLGNAFAIAVDGAGNVFATDAADHTIQKYSSNGTDMGVFATLGATASANSFGLAFDVSGNLYASQSGFRKIAMFSPTGTALGTFASYSDGDNLVSPRGIAFDSAGNLYVANYGSTTSFGNIEVLGADGAHVETLSSSILFGPSAIVVSSIPEPSEYSITVGVTLLTFVSWRRYCPATRSRSR